MRYKIRQWLIKKLLKESDGYVYVGLREDSPINFYYDENINKYVLGKRRGNFYYTQLQISGWCSYMSRYLPWGDTLIKPKVVPFQRWIYGISEQIQEEYQELRGAKG